MPGGGGRARRGAGRAARDEARLKALAALTAPRLAAAAPVARPRRAPAAASARGLAPDDVDALDDDRRAAPAHARVVAGAGRALLAGGRAPAAWRGRAG